MGISTPCVLRIAIQKLTWSWTHAASIPQALFYLFPRLAGYSVIMGIKFVWSYKYSYKYLYAMLPILVNFV